MISSYIIYHMMRYMIWYVMRYGLEKWHGMLWYAMACGMIWYGMWHNMIHDMELANILSQLLTVECAEQENIKKLCITALTIAQRNHRCCEFCSQGVGDAGSPHHMIQQSYYNENLCGNVEHHFHLLSFLGIENKDHSVCTVNTIMAADHLVTQRWSATLTCSFTG